MAEHAGSPRRWFSLRRAWWLGIVAPALFTAVYVIEDVERPGVNPWQQSISFLSHGRWGWVQNTDFLVSGAAGLLFAATLGLGAAARADPAREWRLACLQGLAAVALAVVGVVRQQPLGAVPPPGLSTPFGYLTVAGMVHIAAAVGLFSAMLASCALEALAPGASTAWRRASLAASLMLLASLALFVDTAANGGNAGLWERVAALVAGAWIASLAVGRRPSR